jgi:CRISPR-associated protein Cmr3
MMQVLEIFTRDPVIARDGRPFGATQGHRMKSLDWLYPSVTAGMVRTILGEKNGGNFGPKEIADLKRVAVSGPLPKSGSQLFFPAPLDLAVEQVELNKHKAWASRPRVLEKDEGTDLPSYLAPVLLPSTVEDFKPAKVPAFWSAAKMTEWLANASGNGFTAPPDPSEYPPKPLRGLLDLGYLKLEKDERYHVSIAPATYAAKEAQLFMTVGITSIPGVSISLRIETDSTFASHLQSLNEWATLGGERRMVRVATTQENELWVCPAAVRTALAKTNLLRMVLATPALFKGGWKPGWINDRGEGEFAGVGLQLMGACVDRWKPISGWSYEKPRGPKPGLRLVPAGSVYFFKATGSVGPLAEQWLEPVSDFADDGQSGRDGFGLALWGTWAPHD